MPGPLSFDDLRSIADTLAVGFQALLNQVEEQKKIEDNLRYRLEQAIHKSERTETSSNTFSGEISDWRDEIVKQIGSSISDHRPSYTAFDETILKAQAAVQHWKKSTMPALVQPGRCPVRHKPRDQQDLEHDFTTPGRIGDLGCPFANMSTNGDAQCGPDPIAEEFHGEKASAASRSSAAAGSRCPIRFLDKHSPEEIAQYFENHKHEIPRSHQICVKRYQANEQSIRQLDAKYGSLVSMIQGLGNKHKQYLPKNEKVADEPEQSSTKAVEHWAENVSHDSTSAEGAERMPHFERPLRDVRVGESPSRPWGISIPVDRSPAPSALPSVDGSLPSAKPHLNVPLPGLNLDNALPQCEIPKQEQQRPAASQPQIIFNGPVFFGYSAEQAALFLNNLNIQGGN